MILLRINKRAGVSEWERRREKKKKKWTEFNYHNKSYKCSDGSNKTRNLNENNQSCSHHATLENCDYKTS